jgi:hypothetical protein
MNKNLTFKVITRNTLESIGNLIDYSFEKIVEYKPFIILLLLNLIVFFLLKDFFVLIVTIEFYLKCFIIFSLLLFIFYVNCIILSFYLYLDLAYHLLSNGESCNLLDYIKFILKIEYYKMNLNLMCESHDSLDYADNYNNDLFERGTIAHNDDSIVYRRRASVSKST